MSYSQHDFYHDDPSETGSNLKKRKFSSILAVLLLLVGGTYLVQTTLAANISINSGPVEFGQGIAQTTTCSGATNLTITPSSTFTNASGGGAFYFSSVTVSNVPDSCYGKDFTIRAYGDTNSNPLALFNSSTTGVVVWNDGGTFRLSSGLSGASITSGTGTFTATFTSPVALASAVFKITIESVDHTYSIGDNGPGGGVVVYDAGSRNSWGRYIEVAPGDWNGVTGDATGNFWCSDPVLDVNSTTTQIGFAKENTDRMISPNCTSGIGIKARSYLGGGKSDWSVPTLAEMQLISTLASIVPGIINEGPSGTVGYWVSNGGTGAGSWVANVQSVGGGIGGVNKSQTGPYLRPIRYF